jgi:hypothetical protein
VKVYGNDSIAIRGKKIEVQLAEIAQGELKFYLENPRLYTIVRVNGREPTQEEVEETLARMDHVKQLAQSIKEHGGLIDAVVVQGRTSVVLEGNSRLAAYRLLAKEDPIKWGTIRAKVLPENTTESEIFSLLGEYHIIGKRDWAPFEQAGYLYRRHKTHGVNIQDLAKEVPLSVRTISHLISVYQFMVERKERDVGKWSYYDEYLKSNSIKKARKQYPELDDLVVRKIRSGEIPRAVDIRDDLKKVVQAGGNVLHKFATGKKSFRDSVSAAIDKGTVDHGVKHLRKFREWLGGTDVQREMLKLEGDSKKEGVYELKKINAVISRLVKKLSPGR